MSDIDISKFRKLDGGLLLIMQQLLQTGSVTQTASNLNLSQSTISQALGRLRDLFEDPLFLRKPHGIEPTQHALELESQISALIDLASTTLNAGTSFDPAHSDRNFTLSAPEFVTATMAMPLLNLLSTSAPNAGLTFVHSAESEVFEQLRRGELVAAVGRFEESHTDVAVTLLYEDEFCIACRRNHAISRGKQTTEKYQAANHIWANSPTEIIPRDTEFDYSNFKGSIVPRWLTALTIAARSDYIATCPRRLAESQADLLNLDILDLPKPEPITVSIAHRKIVRDKGSEWFIDQIFAVAK